MAARQEGCQPDGMSFFDSIPPPPPPPEPVRQRRPAWEQPDAAIPGSVAGDLILIRTGQVALAIGSVRAYPNGFEFTAHVRMRGDDQDEPAWHDPFDRHGRRRTRTPGDALRLGLLYADGRRAARRWDDEFWVHPLPPEGPVTFAASWLEYGAAETSAELDGSAIRQAAARAVILWPEEPESELGGGHAWRSQRITAYNSDPPVSEAESDQPGAEGADPGG